jgi:hypothetical protein
MITWKQANPKDGYYSANGMYQVSQEKLWVAYQHGTVVGVGKSATDAQRAAEEHDTSGG